MEQTQMKIVQFFRGIKLNEREEERRGNTLNITIQR